MLEKISNEYKCVEKSALDGNYYHHVLGYNYQDDASSDDYYYKKCHSLKYYVDNINSSNQYPLKMYYTENHARGKFVAGDGRFWANCHAGFTWKK